MAPSRFLAALAERGVLGAGAVGTELLARGALPDRPLDELNLTRPQAVLDLHRDYREAGADLIKTNTFLSNRLRLRASGLQERVREINLAGSRLARAAAPGAFVAGCVGPLGEFPEEGKEEAYGEQCRALAEGGCDVLLLETFTVWPDLWIAMKAARTAGLPVVAQVAGGLEVVRSLGLSSQAPNPVDGVGVNCVLPADALERVVQLGQLTRAPRSAFPSGGIPGSLISPEVFAEGIRRLVDAGVRLVGGCCGTGPAHIRAAAAALGRGR